jgi:hypothetical protein
VTDGRLSRSLPPPHAYSKPRSNRLAIAGVLCGIIGVPLFFIPVPAVLAVVLGVIGHRRARDLGGEIMAVIGVTLGVVVVLLFGLLLVRNFYDVTNLTSTSNIGVGTCLKEVYPERDVVRKNCSARHGSEVVGIVRHPAPPGAPYPQGFDLNFEANDLCRSPFAEYVGATYDQSPSTDGFVTYPTEAEWRRGDRTVVCFAIGKPAVPSIGSVRGTAGTH